MKDKRSQKGGVIFWTIALGAIVGVVVIDYISFNIKRAKAKISKEELSGKSNKRVDKNTS